MGRMTENITVTLAIGLGTLGSLWLSPLCALPGAAAAMCAPSAQVGEPAPVAPTSELGTTVAAEAAMPAAEAEPTDETRLTEEELEGAGLLFNAHSLESSFSVRGRYTGHMRWEDGALVLRLSRALVESSKSDDRQRLEGLRLSLAERRQDGGWRLVQRGELHPVGVDVTGPARWMKWPDFELRLEDVDLGALDGRWFVIEHELWITDAERNPGHNAWTYVHADPDFTQRWLATLDGC